MNNRVCYSFIQLRMFHLPLDCICTVAIEVIIDSAKHNFGLKSNKCIITNYEWCKSPCVNITTPLRELMEQRQ